MPEAIEEDYLSRIEFHYVDHYLINKENCEEYKPLVMNIIESSNYCLKFELNTDELNQFFSDLGFEVNEITYRYSNNKGCVLELALAVVDKKEQSYFIIISASFEKGIEYSLSYTLNFNPSGLPRMIKFAKPKRLLKDLYLKSMSYEIDDTTFKIDQIWYFLEDCRPLQKGINGTVPMVVERPIKSILQEDGTTLHDVNIYDVHYFVFKSGELESILLSDILKICEISVTKLYGSSFTHFLRTNKMFNKRELDLIRMAYI
jgi:hypothetical protein